MTPATQDGKSDQDHHDDRPGDHELAFVQIQFGKLQGHEIHDTLVAIHERGRLGEFFRLAQFGFEGLDDLRHVELQQGGVSAGEPPDVNRGDEHIKVSLLQRADVVAAHLGDLGDFVDGKVFGFARCAELFGDRRHVGYF